MSRGFDTLMFFVKSIKAFWDVLYTVRGDREVTQSKYGQLIDADQEQLK